MTKKKALTLIELLVALSLFSALLLFLFTTLSQYTSVGSKSRIRAEQEMDLVRFDLKVQQCLRRIEGESENIRPVYVSSETDKTPKALAFYYKRTLQKPYHHTGNAQGFLFLNQKHELCLASYPERGQDSLPILEILLSEVASWDLLFLDPKDGAWTKEWDFPYIPDAIQIHLTRNQNSSEETFTYLLSSTLSIKKS